MGIKKYCYKLLLLLLLPPKPEQEVKKWHPTTTQWQVAYTPRKMDFEIRLLILLLDDGEQKQKQ